MEIRDIVKLLSDEYGVYADELAPISAGVGGDTYRVWARGDGYILKLSEVNPMNHARREPELCGFLLRSGIKVPRFISGRGGAFTTVCADGRIAHLQEFVDGRSFAQNTAPDWLMAELPKQLGSIHRVLLAYPSLPVGIGSDFFRMMTAERAKASYARSLELALSAGREDLADELRFRIRFTDRVSGLSFDMGRLSCRNTHGDYTINQIICGEKEINAVVDWTSACIHPVVWELARSFFLAEPACSDGTLPEDKFRTYMERYCEEFPLSDYDRENALLLYVYQLAVCDYYAQYFSSRDEKKAEYLSQARFATRVLKAAEGRM